MDKLDLLSARAQLDEEPVPEVNDSFGGIPSFPLISIILGITVVLVTHTRIDMGQSPKNTVHINSSEIREQYQ